MKQLAELRKIFLYGALFMIAFLLWTQWEKDYPATPSKGAINEINKETVEKKQERGETGFVPSVSTTTAEISENKGPLPTVDQQIPQERLVKIKTDVLDITIDRLGGNIIEAKLLKYPQAINEPNNPTVLLNNAAATRYIAQSGLVSTTDTQTPSLLYSSSQASYSIDKQNEIAVKLTAKTKDDVDVTKTFKFKRGDYLINLDYQVANKAKEPWQGSVYSQLTRTQPADESSILLPVSAYAGASISDPKNKLYEKVTFADMAKTPLNRSIEGGWAAMQQHYFLSAWVPNAAQKSQYYSHAGKQGEYTIGFMGPLFKVAPGETISKDVKLYIGPELPNDLKKIAPGLDLTVDYGILWFISIFLLWVLEYIYGWVGNWGWAIVIVTLFIKLAFYHLSATSYRSMANMRKLQPKMQSLRERYANDKAKLSQAMMDLYKSEKVNPLGGCLPIIVQIPVFIALYWVLLESVQLRHAPFILWIKDLTAPDPYYVLPLLMGATMFIQQKLSPAPPDPTQAKVMMALPIVFTFLFLGFPAGLVLYWVVNNTLSILQQWYITRKYA